MAETMQEEQEEQQHEERIERKPKRNDRWVCPKCSTWIILHVRSTYPPTCNSPAHSTSGPVLMELKSKK